MVAAALVADDTPTPIQDDAAGRRRTFGAGAKIAGRYRILEFVAQGGMGEVYRAHDTVLDEVVALKTLASAIQDDGASLARFRYEVQLARLVTHPGVCRVHDVGIWADPDDPAHEIPFLTMAYLQGKPLAKFLREKAPLGATKALALLRPIVEALAAIHEGGVVHRDLTSHNVFLIASGDQAARVPAAAHEPFLRPVLMDFGLARRSSQKRHGTFDGSGRLLGTPDYMAPEQVEGGRATPATDVYALGLLAFEMLTGVLPFRAETPLATAVARLHKPVPRLTQFRPDLAGTDWISFLDKCLAVDPTKRFTSASAVVLPGSATYPRGLPFGFLGRWLNHRSAAALSAAGLVAGLAAAVYWGRPFDPAAEADQMMQRSPPYLTTHALKQEASQPPRPKKTTSASGDLEAEVSTLPHLNQPSFVQDRDPPASPGIATGMSTRAAGSADKRNANALARDPAAGTKNASAAGQGLQGVRQGRTPQLPPESRPKRTLVHQDARRRPRGQTLQRPQPSDAHQPSVRRPVAHLPWNDRVQGAAASTASETADSDSPIEPTFGNRKVLNESAPAPSKSGFDPNAVFDPYK